MLVVKKCISPICLRALAQVSRLRSRYLGHILTRSLFGRSAFAVGCLAQVQEFHSKNGRLGYIAGEEKIGGRVKFPREKDPESYTLLWRSHKIIRNESQQSRDESATEQKITQEKRRKRARARDGRPADPSGEPPSRNNGSQTFDRTIKINIRTFFHVLLKRCAL